MNRSQDPYAPLTFRERIAVPSDCTGTRMRTRTGIRTGHPHTAIGCIGLSAGVLPQTPP
jgi:hypothetical protein